MPTQSQHTDDYDTGDRDDARLGNERFIGKESIAARAYSRENTQNAAARALANAEAHEMILIQKAHAEHQARALSEQQHMQRAKEAKRKERSAHALKRRGLSSFSRWIGLGAACTAFSFQFLFGLISLVGLGAHVVVAYFQEETWIGSFLGFFIDFAKYFPGETFGYAFWMLATVVAFCTFLVFLLWYYFTGIRVFHSTLSSLITILCLALSLLPVTNLFPWLVLWILYINSSTLFSSLTRTGTSS